MRSRRTMCSAVKGSGWAEAMETAPARSEAVASEDSSACMRAPMKRMRGAEGRQEGAAAQGTRCRSGFRSGFLVERLLHLDPLRQGAQVLLLRDLVFLLLHHAAFIGVVADAAGFGVRSRRTRD